MNAAQGPHLPAFWALPVQLVAPQHSPPQSLSLAQLTLQLWPRQLVGPSQAPTPQVSVVCAAPLAIEVPQLWLAVQWIWQSVLASVQLTWPHVLTSSQCRSQVLALHVTELPQALVPAHVTLHASPAQRIMPAQLCRSQ